MWPDESRRVYDGKLIDVTVEQWGDNVREIVEHPSAVAIVPIDASGKIVLVRQLREAVRGELVELPAGKRDAGEDPLATGKRELREECGLTGGDWTLLTEFWTTPGFCRERMHVFLAERVEEGEAEPDEDEVVEIVRWSVDELESRLGEIEDAKTLVGLLLYLRRLASTS
jgi:ADP-ribose pyrophosphatase